jgi:hypothetical protein
MLTAACGSASASSTNANNYFRGKTITVIVPDDPGGDADVSARLAATLLPKYLPGHPRIVIRNDSAGNNVNGAQLAYQSKPDGLTAGLINYVVWREQLAGVNIDGWDGFKARYAGTLNVRNGPIYLCTDRRKISSWDQVLTLDHPLKAGHSGPGSLDIIPAALEYVGANVKTFYGYKNNAATLKGFEDGESEATSSCEPEHVIGQFDELDKIFAPIAYLGPSVDQAWMNTLGWTQPVPSVFDLKDVEFTPGEKVAIEAAYETREYEYEWAFPPGTADSVLNLWTTALQKVAADPEFVQKSAASGYPAGYGSGEALLKLLNDVKSTVDPDPDAVKLFKVLAGIK